MQIWLFFYCKTQNFMLLIFLLSGSRPTSRLMRLRCWCIELFSQSLNTKAGVREWSIYLKHVIIGNRSVFIFEQKSVAVFSMKIGVTSSSSWPQIYEHNVTTSKRMLDLLITNLGPSGCTSYRTIHLVATGLGSLGVVPVLGTPGRTSCLFGQPGDLSFGDRNVTLAGGPDFGVTDLNICFWWMIWWSQIRCHSDPKFGATSLNIMCQCSTWRIRYFDEKRHTIIG